MKVLYGPNDAIVEKTVMLTVEQIHADDVIAHLISDEKLADALAVLRLPDHWQVYILEQFADVDSRHQSRNVPLNEAARRWMVRYRARCKSLEGVVFG